jgi:hypothetical protein
MLVAIFLYLFSACLLSVCLCDHLYESLFMFGIEIWKNILHEYHKNKEQYLNMLNYNFFL